MYLLDTNVISETIKRQPHPSLVEWLHNTPDHVLYLSSLTLGEIRKGICKTTQPTHQQNLSSWVEHHLKPWFDDRILPVDNAVAEYWGNILGNLTRTLPAVDTLLAATAMHHNLSLITRNTKDFDIPNLRVINPWHS